MSVASESIISMLSNMVDSGFNHLLSRADFDYTLRRTNYPAQVEAMKAAGLNPALAYGQLSSPQGQVLGNYQRDSLQGVRDIEAAREAKSNREYRDAETDVLRATEQYIVAKAANEARKSGYDADMQLFDKNHQLDRYLLEIRGKGLVNSGQQLQNQGYHLDNLNKIVNNEILSIQRDIEEFNRSIKKIDAEKHSDYVDAEIKRLVSSTNLAMKESWALGKKVPAEVSDLEWNVRKVRREIYEMRKNGKVTRQRIKALASYQELENKYIEWLGRDPRVRSMIENHRGGLSDEIISLLVTPSY